MSPKIFEPSSGGNGSRLKIPRKMEMWNMYRSVIIMNSGVVRGRYFNGIKIDIDIKKFENGPASATNALSLIGFLKFCGLTGTGFPQPIILVTAKTNVPNGSRWRIGFSDSLPCDFAVLSPKRYAIPACAAS